MQTTIQKYSPIEAALEDLKSRHLNVVIDVSTKEGMKKAKEGRAELKAVRIRLDNARKEEKEESLNYCRFVDSEAKRIQLILDPMEEAYDKAIKAEEKRIADEENAKIRAAQEAEAEKQRLAKEAEEKKLAEERARLKAEEQRLAELEAKYEAERKEKDRLAQEALDLANKKLAEERAALEAEKKATEDKRIAEEKAAKEKIEAAERESRLKIEAEEKRLKEIKDKEEAKAREEQLKKEAEERAEREKKEAAEREERRKQEDEKRSAELAKAKLLDGKEMLRTFLHRYGNITEFETVSNAIEDYFSKEGSYV